jgi:hypothetical protein
LGFGSILRKKAATFNLILALIANVTFKLHPLRLQVQLEQELILCPFPQFPGGPLPTWSL